MTFMLLFSNTKKTNFNIFEFLCVIKFKDIFERFSIICHKEYCLKSFIKINKKRTNKNVHLKKYITHHHNNKKKLNNISKKISEVLKQIFTFKNYRVKQIHPTFYFANNFFCVSIYFKYFFLFCSQGFG